MATPEQSLTDPLTLLPTVLKHLSSLEKKPALASSVFATIRRAFRTTNAQPFITPLLLPLTSIALTSPLRNVRVDAAATCISLLRALISARGSTLAAAYIQDLVHLASALVNTSASEPVQCHLRRYFHLAKDTTGFNITAHNNLPIIANSAHSLEALLHLLSHLVPQLDSNPGRHPNENAQHPERIFPHLWICIGSSARTAVLEFASSYSILSGRCGEAPRIAAVGLLERALDSSSGFTVPSAIRETLVATAEAILKQHNPQSSVTSTESRAVLYRIAQTASPDRVISANMWTQYGLREALVCPHLSSQLRDLSRKGLVRPYFQDLHMQQEVNKSIQEPPKKKLRLSQHRSESSAQATDTSPESSPTRKGESSHSAVRELQRVIQSLESIYVCLDDSAAMRLLASTCELTADSLNLIADLKPSCEKSFREWLSFASSLSHIVKDLSVSLRESCKAEMWDANLDLCQGILLLIESMDNVRSANSFSPAMSKILEEPSTLSTTESLLLALLNIVDTGSVAVKFSSEIPVSRLGLVLWKLGTLSLERNIRLQNDETLLNSWKNLQDASIGTSHLGNDARASLIRGCHHVLNVARRSSAFEHGSRALPRLLAFLSANMKTDAVIGATLTALGDVLCHLAECRRIHGSAIETRASQMADGRVIELETWVKVHDAVMAILEDSAKREVLPDAVRCYGVVCIHAPPEKVAHCASVLISVMCNSDSREARSLSYEVLHEVLERDFGEEQNKRKLERVSETSSYIRQSGKGAPTRSREDEAELTKAIWKHLETYREQQKSSSQKARHERMLSFAFIMRLGQSMEPSSNVVGEVLVTLLLESCKELSQYENNGKSLQVSASRNMQHSSDEILRPLGAWNSMVRSISHVSGHFASLRSPKGKKAIDQQDKREELFNVPVREKQSLVYFVTTYLIFNIREWLPNALSDMLTGDSLVSFVAAVMTGGDEFALWTRLSRPAAEHIVKTKDKDLLALIAAKINQPASALVARVSSGALARAAMSQSDGLDADPNGRNAFLINTLRQPVHILFKERAGKVVQKLVMEFGTSREPLARSALAVLSRSLFARESHDLSSDTGVGGLLSRHFMLVMDAVNRGLFHSQAASYDRFRYLRILGTVISLSAKELHLFIPKILATLKLALDTGRGNQRFLKHTMHTWMDFLITLGSRRVIPHLGSILSTLLPFYKFYEDELSALNALLEKCAQEHIDNRRDIILLLRVTDYEPLHGTATMLEAARPESALPSIREGSAVLMSVRDLSRLTRSVVSVITHLSNGTIEVLCAKYLLHLLQNNRERISCAAAILGEGQRRTVTEDSKALATICGSLVLLLTRTKNTDCQLVIMQCIGEIGAIDPGFVSEHYQGPTKEVAVEVMELKRRCPESVHGLVAVLLDEFLIPTLTRSEKRDRSSSRQNRVGLVIQELLRVCGCERNTAERASKCLKSEKSGDGPVPWEKILIGQTDDENAVLFWENLSATTRNAAEPYLAEPFDVQQYKVVFGANAANDSKMACQPVWEKVKATSTASNPASAQVWRRQLVVQLVDFVGDQGSLEEVLKSLRPVLRYEDDVAAFVFPIVIACTLYHEQHKKDREVTQFLIRELALILQEEQSPQLLFDLFDDLRFWRDTQCAGQARVARSMSENVSTTGAAGADISKKKPPIEVCVEQEKDSDPLSLLVDLDGREAKSLSLFLQAQSALRAKSYSRAVMLAETHIRNLRRKEGFEGWASYVEEIIGNSCSDRNPRKCRETESLRLLQKAFAEIEDADNMSGIACLRGSSSFTEEVIDREAACSYDEALMTYERALGAQPLNPGFQEGYLTCLMTLGRWESMLSHSKGLFSSLDLGERELRETAKASGIAAAWRLGRWDELKEFHTVSCGVGIHAENENPGSSWVLQFRETLGDMFVSMRDRNMNSISELAATARRQILVPTVKAAREGYSRSYPIVGLLHSLSDVEDSSHEAGFADRENSACRAAREVDHRETLSQHKLITLRSRITSSKSSLRAREPLISVKRVCYELLNQTRDAARANLELASLARKGGNLHAASVCAYRASSIASADNDIRNAAVLELAQIRREQGDCSDALAIVKTEIETLLSLLETDPNDGLTSFATEISDRLCTANVLAGTWIEESRGEPSDVILSYFERAAAHGSSREEPFYALGKHYDSLLQASSSLNERTSLDVDLNSSRAQRRLGGQSGSCTQHHSQYVPLVIESFTKALVNGHSRIFEALPRMLTVWFDYHTELHDSNAGGAVATVASDVKREMKKAFDTVPIYMWMTAVPQLMSRILHPQKAVRDDVASLLARLVRVFPDQCCWTILPSMQLKCQDRKRAASNILHHAVSMTKKTGKANAARENARILRARLQSAGSVVQSFIGICSTLLPKDKRGRRENCAHEFRDLKSYLRTDMAVNPILPTLDSLTTRLPFGEGIEHRPFEVEPVRIVDIEDYVLVMISLMRPRRIGLVGSDGQTYRYLAKKENQGDMRKDSRLVELITVVNRLLSKTVSSRDNSLELKTYAVLPLTEETGMIEWVNDLVPLRKIVRDEHNKIAELPDARQIERKYQEKANHKKFLVDWAFKKFPPVLDKFFLHRFGHSISAEAWLESRNVWTESTAVWSMVGYIVGLGDRHGENLLIETTSGRCVHVDFAMLFDKGQKLKVPEIVPFRLTRNMVTAMGIGGYEGVYRKVSETVMESMRSNADAILGVLESFLHDPLADWGRGEKKVNKGGVLASKEAWQTRAAVKAKLTGMVDTSGLALSIPGQVDRLIHEATSIDKLSKMFLWWSAWI